MPIAKLLFGFFNFKKLRNENIKLKIKKRNYELQRIVSF